MSTTNWRTTLCVSGSFLCGLLYRFIRNKHDKQGDAAIDEVLMYGGPDEAKTKQIGLDNLFCIYYVIAHASRTVDVCVPGLDSETITKCLINVQQKNNAKIRVAIHGSDRLDNEQKYAEHGIDVKIIRPSEPLEHEFILIDAAEEDGVAVVGSLDYDASRVNCNRDSTILTSDKKVVLKLKQEFDRIWNTSKVKTRVPEDLDAIEIIDDI